MMPMSEMEIINSRRVKPFDELYDFEILW